MIITRIKNRFFYTNPYKGLISRSEYFRIINLKKFTTDQTLLFGHPFSFSDNQGFLHSLREIFQEEVYKFKSPSNQPIIIDAGSNIGLSVTYFKRLYPDAKIIAFEPDPLIFKLLQNNISTLGFTTVDARNSAAWIEDTELEFFSEGSLAGSTEVEFNTGSQKYAVKAERLKKWLTGDYINFLKIDIEGAENTLLFDIGNELRNVDNLFLEYHSITEKDQVLGDILNIIRLAGFRYFIKASYNYNGYPFIDKIEAGFDMQINIFCYRKGIN